jgi:gluconolactonase
VRTLIVLAALMLPLQGPAFAAPAAEVVATGLQFPEGTVFIKQDLYFVDYATSTVYRLDGHQATPVWQQKGCGANGLVAFRNGLLVACYDSGNIEGITLNGQSILTIDRDREGLGFDHPNDLARDNDGGVYFTASGGDGQPGKIYYLAITEQRPREVASAIQNANGVALSPTGKVLYLGESSTDKILQFDVANDGSLNNRRDFLSLDAVLPGATGPRHTPDGIRTDSLGRLFVSLYNGGGFAVFDPSGHLLANVPVPGAHHSNLALSFDEKTVYGTTINDASAFGQAGALYRTANPVAR